MVELNIHPWCNCHRRGAHRSQDGYTLDRPSGLWVCSRCRKPSKMNYERSVLGINHIPQPKHELDIFAYEAQYEMRKVAVREVAEALDWEEDSEDEYEYN